MKTLIAILSFGLLIFAASCKKETKIDNPSFTGKWTVVGNWLSIGGPMFYKPVSNSNDYVTFNTNGTVEGTVFTKYPTYTLHNDSVIFTEADKSTVQNYRYSIKNDSLTMSPIGPIRCYEGCAIVFIKK